MASLGVVIVNYFSADLVARQVAALDYPGPLQVVVMDNSANDDEWRTLHEVGAHAGWQTLRSPANVGFSAACNTGAAVAVAAGAEFLLFLNPDCFIDAANLAELLATAAEGPSGLWSPVLLDGRLQRLQEFTTLDWFTGDAHHVPAPAAGSTQPPWLSGACLLLDRVAFERLGGFDEAFFLYWEDVDLSVRARDLGLTVRIVPGVTAVHDVGGTQDVGTTGGKSSAYMRNMVRSRMLFAARHLGPVGQVRWLLFVPLQAARIARGAGVHRGRTALWAWVTAVSLGTVDAVAVLRTRRPSRAGLRATNGVTHVA